MHHLTLTSLRQPGVAGSSPSTITMSLAIPIPSSSSPNGLSNWRRWLPGASPGCSVSGQVPKFVQSHWWGPWMMIWYLEYCGPSVWNPPPPITFSKYHLLKKRKKNSGGESTRVVRNWDLLNRVVTSLDSSGSVDWCGGLPVVFQKLIAWGSPGTLCGTALNMCVQVALFCWPNIGESLWSVCECVLFWE